ncbi:MAG TPA: nuclear transport factor 2 family protein [Kribbella sp.]|uniref:nuclear transport factor 2 family protein n=1 Tax=Kribbella sp. TaxID=1871183 RepID=UPI002D77E23C|nr:nuclear transport factor 2 family protein [Kribbella sp.]HET6297658.1 nuclear transport factor 2 family protein [Kribbella sp.]
MPSAREEMVRTMCAQVDSGDAGGFARWFAADATYTFANGPTLVGRDAIEAATAGAAAALPWVRHSIDQVAELGDQLFCRFTIHTETPTGAALAMPCVTVIELHDTKIIDYRVHMDITPAMP